MDHIDIARSIAGAGLKFTPVAGFIGIASIPATVAVVQLVAYALAAAYAALQIYHLAWQTHNERQDRKRRRADWIRPHVPGSRDRG